MGQGSSSGSTVRPAGGRLAGAALGGAGLATTAQAVFDVRKGEPTDNRLGEMKLYDALIEAAPQLYLQAPQLARALPDPPSQPLHFSKERERPHPSLCRRPR